MFRRIALLLIVLCATHAASAQDSSARLRLFQLTYADSGATADVQIDGDLVFAGITWPFMTSYVELPPGEHSLTTVLTDGGEMATTTVVLEAGRSYSVIAHGDYATGVTFALVDESAAPLAETGGAGILLNLTSIPIVDLRVDDVPVISRIPPGGYDVLSLPAATFTIAGQLGGQSYHEEFTPLSNALLLGVVRTTPDGDLQIIYQRSSSLTVAEYLKAILPDTLTSRFANALPPEVIDATLPDDDAFTLFVPVNAALERAGSLPADAALLAGHATTQPLPPTVLPNYTVLSMLDGRTARLAFSDTSSGYWEIDGVPILWDLRLANGVIYAIDGVLEVQEG